MSEPIWSSTFESEMSSSWQPSNVDFFFFFFPCSMQWLDMGSQFPDQVLNPGHSSERAQS